MSYLIGVDGGGTGCRVAVADETGNILARAKGGPANIATNLALAHRNIMDTIEQAVDTAGLARAEISKASAVLGLAGANLGDYRTRLLPELPFAQADIVTDAKTTLVGAIGTADGCIGAIGTGSVFGRQVDGVFSQIGGWGFLLGDDGSGARLGRDLLHLTLLAHDGAAPHSPLTREVMGEFGNDPSRMVEQAKKFTPDAFGHFAPRIIAAAGAGDENAETLLARHSEIVRKYIDAAGFNPSKAFCLLGGLGPVYLERLPTKYKIAAADPLGNTLDGAIILAKQMHMSLAEP